MTLIDLKKSIETQNIPDDLIIFLCSENSFIAEQYVDAICEINNLVKTRINTLQDQMSALSLVLGTTDELRILKTDVFEEALVDYSSIKNTVIICNKIDKKVRPLVEDYIVEVAKLADWQVKSYIKLICPVLNDDEVNWLYTATNGDVYRMINEIDKIKLFPAPEQHTLLNAIRFSPDSDLYAVSIFDLADAIIRGNKPFILDFLSHESVNFDLMQIVGATLQKVKNIILATQNSGKTASEIGINDKYLYRLRKDWSNFPADRLQALLAFLSGIDLKLKTGALEMSKAAQIDYLITNTIF
jgi:hypothetical protein